MKYGRPELEFNERTHQGTALPLPLIRIVIGKVKNWAILFDVLRRVPLVRDRTWDGATWVKDALEALREQRNALGTSELDWDIVKPETLNYFRFKEAQHRFDGRGNFNTAKPATYDLLRRAELIG